MKIEIEHYANTLTARIIGEIDHHNAKKIREKLDTSIENLKPHTLVLDFNQVNFMDSSGIGLIMGRYATMSKIKGQVRVLNVNPSLFKVMKLANLEKISVIKQRGEV